MPTDWQRKSAYFLPYEDGEHRLTIQHLAEDEYPTDSFGVTWYAERGATVGPSVAYFSDQSFDQAAVYSMLLLRCGGECERRILATSGRVVVEEAERGGERIRGFVEQVIFQEGSFNTETQESEVWADGEVWCLDFYRFDSELTTMPPNRR